MTCLLHFGRLGRIGPKPTIAKLSALALLVLAGSAYWVVGDTQAAQSPRPGSYSGSVAADTINFEVSANGTTITNLSTTYNPAVDCAIPADKVHERFPNLKIKKGRFSGSLSISNVPKQSEHFSITGAFSTPGRASGKISGTIKIRSLPTCNNTTQFSVKRKGK